MGDLPELGIEFVSPALAGGFLSIAPLGTSVMDVFVPDQYLCLSQELDFSGVSVWCTHSPLHTFIYGWHYLLNIFIHVFFVFHTTIFPPIYMCFCALPSLLGIYSPLHCPQ